MFEGGFSMADKRLSIMLWALFIFTTIGCSAEEDKKDEQNISVQRLVDGDTYEDFKQITDQEQVQKVKSVIKEAA